MLGLGGEHPDLVPMRIASLTITSTANFGIAPTPHDSISAIPGEHAPVAAAIIRLFSISDAMLLSLMQDRVC